MRYFLDRIKKSEALNRKTRLERIEAAGKGNRPIIETHVSEKRELNPTTGKLEVVARDTKVVKKKAPPIWQADCWILERRHPSEFGKHIQPSTKENEPDPLEQWARELEAAEQMYGDETYESD